MMSRGRRFSKVILCFLGGIVFIASNVYEEKAEIITYYPAPHGKYDHLKTNRLSVGDTNGDGILDVQDQANRDGDMRLTPQTGDPANWPDGGSGQVAYSSDENSLYFWNGTKWVAPPSSSSVLPKTGQTIVYQSGDDGTYQKGYDEIPRFVDNGDGTVTDNATHLMWVKDGNSLGCSYGSKINWRSAINFAEHLNFAGYADWRIPNINELMSLTDFTMPNYSPHSSSLPLIFTNQNGYLWSSTTEANPPGYLPRAWISAEWVTKRDMSLYCGVRPVRDA